MSIREFIRGVRAAIMYEDAPVYYERECHISAGYAFKMPSRRDYSLPVCIALAAAGIAALIWLAKTPAGNQLAYRIAEFVEGLKG